MSKDKRYFITPFRLRKKDFWRSVDLLLAVNPNAEVFAPPKTQDWVPKNWHKISPENVLMCLKYLDRGADYFDWDKHVEEANKVYRFFMQEPKAEKYRRKILSHKGMDEDILTAFIVNNLSSLKLTASEYGYDRNAYSFPGCTNSILSNPSLKTYQYEAVFKHLKQKKALKDHLSNLANVKLKIVPDYIFKSLLRAAVSGRTTKNSYGDRESIFDDRITVRLVKEGIRRQMLEYNAEFPETVKSQEGPSLKDLANKRLALEAKKIAEAKPKPKQPPGKTIVVNLDEL